MEFADSIAQVCYKFYDKLPTKFKPNPSQWTVATFILKSNDLSIVSFGSGTKCVGEHSLSSTGIILNDSHAEIMARRGFLIYIYNQIENAFKNEESIFFLNNSSKKCVLKDGIEFIFFSTQVPCGDCSIMPKKRKATFSDPIQTKIIKLDSETEKDIYRTGAKCLPGAEQDPCLNGELYHLLAQIRTKPGRGDRTLSVSCSDKIARWMRVGIQGALISRLIDYPIIIKTFVFSGGIPYSEESIKRAVIYRDKDGDSSSTGLSNCTHDYPHGHLLKMPTFYQSSLTFIDGKDAQKKPCPLSVVYWNGDPPQFEIIVNGQKQGTTKINSSKLSAAPAISKSKIFLKFLSFIEETEVSYCTAKNEALEYQQCWKTVKRKFFKTWTKKPEWNFKKCDFFKI